MSESGVAAVEPARMHRAVRAVLWSVVVAALGYVALSLWAGWREVVDAIVRIGPWVLLGVFGLSLLNYLLRFFRWGATSRCSVRRYRGASTSMSISPVSH